MIGGAFLGVTAAVVLFLASVYIGAALDERANPDADLAGLAGGFAGAFVGLFLVLIAASSLTVMGRRRGNPLVKGVGIGMFLALIVAGLALGLCAVAG